MKFGDKILIKNEEIDSPKHIPVVLILEWPIRLASLFFSRF